MRRIVVLALLLATSPAWADAPTPPPADLRPMQRYGADHPDCLGWTNGCTICTPKACSTPGIACTPRETVCEAEKPVEPPPVAPPEQKP
ncbi:hypothetical protein GJ654_04890 [Rhodoblastus acidophilus]|uniref:Uncharacterized protein n=1 Tax=Rhodoblastus acidophilus TaxID=1074 RepID=A0A6N8DJ10_RHOAC|nr:hypothetical protein [Rhodoblastus acidophilus]MCW2273589.1 hypothetical protein [Rhodoblastus acidophilus]MTV30327.1 hypothetical protein [Rhodoblastus acidophilus]